jgi:hypothetical protein
MSHTSGCLPAVADQCGQHSTAHTRAKDHSWTQPAPVRYMAACNIFRTAACWDWSAAGVPCQQAESCVQRRLSRWPRLHDDTAVGEPPLHRSHPLTNDVEGSIVDGERLHLDAILDDQQGQIVGSRPSPRGHHMLAGAAFLQRGRAGALIVPLWAQPCRVARKTAHGESIAHAQDGRATALTPDWHGGSLCGRDSSPNGNHHSQRLGNSQLEQEPADKVTSKGTGPQLYFVAVHAFC